MKTTAKKFKNIKNVSREEWLKLRQKGIGGSDVAGIVGISPFTSALKVYLSKVEVIEMTEELNESMEWGNRLEDPVAQAFDDKTDYKVMKSSFMWQHPVHKFMLANLDRVLYHPADGWGVLECKSSHEFRNSHFDGDVIPEEYLLQVLHYMAIMGFDYGYLAVLVGGNKFKYFRVERDEEMIEMIIKLESDFWNNHVVAGVPPMIDGSEASSKVMAALYPADEVEKDSLIGLPENAAVLIKQYEEAKEKEDQFKKVKNEAANQLKDMVGNHHKGIIFDREVRWSPVKGRKGFDNKAFEKDHPELAAKYVKYGKPSRKFTIS